MFKNYRSSAISNTFITNNLAVMVNSQPHYTKVVLLKIMKEGENLVLKTQFFKYVFANTNVNYFIDLGFIFHNSLFYNSFTLINYYTFNFNSFYDLFIDSKY